MGCGLDDRIYLLYLLWSLFAQPNSFLAIYSQLFCQLPTPDTPSIIILTAWDPRYITSGPPLENTASSIVACWLTPAEISLPHRCVATRSALTTENTALLLLGTFASAGTCIPSRCLAMKYSGFQASCNNIIVKSLMHGALETFL
jgi:hypothetical protein